DAIKCRAEIEGARAHRILGTALHVDGENAAFFLLSRDHFCRRSPIGPFGFACHLMGASPLKAGLARTNAVAPSLSIFLNQIKEMLARIDDDSARIVRPGVVNDLRQIFRVEPRGNGSRSARYSSSLHAV